MKNLLVIICCCLSVFCWAQDDGFKTYDNRKLTPNFKYVHEFGGGICFAPTLKDSELLEDNWSEIMYGLNLSYQFKVVNDWDLGIGIGACVEYYPIHDFFKVFGIVEIHRGLLSIPFSDNISIDAFSAAEFGYAEYFGPGYVYYGFLGDREFQGPESVFQSRLQFLRLAVGQNLEMGWSMNMGEDIRESLHYFRIRYIFQPRPW